MKARGVWGEEERGSLELESPLDGRVIERGQPNGLAWPRDVAELLRFTAGFRVGFNEFRFAGAVDLGRSAFPAGLSILEDGMGNDWIVDVDSRTGAWGAVYYDCHDPPVIVLQSPTFERFMLDVEAQFAPISPERVRALADMIDKHSLAVPADNMTPWAAFASRNPTIRVNLTPGEAARAMVADLRGASPGAGFSWAEAHRTKMGFDIRRAQGGEPVFVVVRKPA